MNDAHVLAFHAHVDAVRAAARERRISQKTAWRREEAASRGMEYLGDGSSEQHGRFRLPCGCERNISHRSFSSGKIYCPEHATPALNAAARIKNIKIVGMPNPGYVTCEFPCGCTDVVTAHTVMIGRPLCKNHSPECKHYRPPQPVVEKTAHLDAVQEQNTAMEQKIRSLNSEIRFLKEQLEKEQVEYRKMFDAFTRVSRKLHAEESRPVDVFPSGDLTELAKRCFEQDVAGGEKVPFVEVCDMFGVPRSEVRNALVAAGFFSSPLSIGARGAYNGFSREEFDGRRIEAVNLKAIAIMDSVVTAYLKKQERKAA